MKCQYVSHSEHQCNEIALMKKQQQKQINTDLICPKFVKIQNSGLGFQKYVHIRIKWEMLIRAHIIIMSVLANFSYKNTTA